MAFHALTYAPGYNDCIFFHTVKKWTGKLLLLTQIFLPILPSSDLYLRAMEVDVLIVGQGICGTMLSWFLHKEGKSFLVIDEAAENSASKAAAGVINPVTGRRYVTAWMAEEMIRFAKQSYQELGAHLELTLLHPKTIIDFFPTPQMRNTFVERITENDTYLHSFPDQNLFNPFFQYDFGCGEIRPAYTVQLQQLLPAWRSKLAVWNVLREEKFLPQNLRVIESGVMYDGVTAQKIILCDGAFGAGEPWFSLLPFSANKGEAIILECRELGTDHIFKKGMMLVPLHHNNLFWLGSNYQWTFDDETPSETFYQKSSDLLKHWLKLPFKIVAHQAAVRPATLERRPFVGFHPQVPAIGILNGMGTKGVSLAPFFAHQLVQHLVYGFPITPEADVHRFSRILSKR